MVHLEDWSCGVSGKLSLSLLSNISWSWIDFLESNQFLINLLILLDEFHLTFQEKKSIFSFVLQIFHLFCAQLKKFNGSQRLVLFLGKSISTGPLPKGFPSKLLNTWWSILLRPLKLSYTNPTIVGTYF